MRTEIFIEDGEIVSVATVFGKEQRFKTKGTIGFFEKLESFNLRKVVKKKNSVSFKIKFMKITINNYDIINEFANKNGKTWFNNLNQEIKRQKEKLKRRRINRVKSLAIGTCVILIGNKIFVEEQAPSLQEEPTTSIEISDEEIEINDNTIGEQELIFLNEEENVNEEVATNYEYNYNVHDYGIEIACGDRAYTEKAIYTRENYGDLITKYANMYGISPDIMIALATQERGVHSNVMDSGGATGLMQLQNSIWIGNSVSAYNYETDSYDTLYIDENNIGDLETNIKAGCMYFSNCMEYMNNNPLAALQCYNMGYGSMQTILDEYSLTTGLSVDEILQNKEDLGWMDYIDVVSWGDPSYITNVLSWLEEDSNLTFKTKDDTSFVIKIANAKQNVRI